LPLLKYNTRSNCSKLSEPVPLFDSCGFGCMDEEVKTENLFRRIMHEFEVLHEKMVFLRGEKDDLFKQKKAMAPNDTEQGTIMTVIKEITYR
jgi:hypothetical protein